MIRDENWFDAVGKNDWRQEQIEQRQKQKNPLSDGEMSKVFDDIVAGCYGEDDFWIRFARAIEKAHGIE